MKNEAQANNPFNKPIRDIRKKDVDEAIRMMANEPKEIAVRIKKPVKVDISMESVSVDVFHHNNDGSHFEDFWLKVAVGLLAVVASATLIWWVMHHG